MEKLRTLLKKVDDKGYKAYKTLQGSYDFLDYILHIDHVQGDPFADPSRIRITVSDHKARFPIHLFNTTIRKIALEDFLGRAVATAIKQHAKGQRGSGKSGLITIATSGQQALPRNAVIMRDKDVEVRMQLALPASGRSILGKQAEAMLFDELSAIVSDALFYDHLDANTIDLHVNSIDDQEYLRHWLTENKLVAFIANGSILPRASGVDDHPLPQGAIPFQTPASLAHEVVLPHAGKIHGMGIPTGVTVVVGGGFHGKSTVLHAIERGIYNHIPGDGREKVVTQEHAVKIRAEDGRAISQVNISPFIDNLPFNRDTQRFSTENASGSTSQAANIIEALECGTKLLLIDEDTSATNFMIRDQRMQALVSKDKEPITPLAHRIRELYESYGVSTILVMGGSGDYFSEADTVIMMDAYQAYEISKQAKELATPLHKEHDESTNPITANTSQRKAQPTSLSPYRKDNNKLKIQALGIDKLIYGDQTINLSYIEQLIDNGQSLAIGYLINYYTEHYAANYSMVEGLQLTLTDVEAQGMDIILPYINGGLALPRLHETVAVVNRMRGLQLM